MNKILVGVDFGGTKILTGAMTNSGEILCEPVRIPTDKDEAPTEAVNRIAGSIEEILRRIGRTAFEIGGIGLGVTGPLDIKMGTILECPQLPRLHFFPLRKSMEERFGIPVYMDNDANCLIYGETLFGSGKGKKNVLGFTLGTGLGCAIILGGKIFLGSTESAGEIWPSFYEGGTIEDLVSGAGVSKIYERITGQERSALEIASLAEMGNSGALLTWREFGEHLATAISWSINLIDPEIVILGGSISNAFGFFSSALEERLRKHVCPVPAEKTKVVPASLGSNGGFIGAAALAIREEGK